MEEENQQQENSVNPVEEQSAEDTPKSKKGLIITIVALSFLIVGGAIAGYLYITSSSPTIDTPTPVVQIDVTPSAEEPIIELIEEFETCDAKAQWLSDVEIVINSSLVTLGMKELLDQGYKVVQICNDLDNDRIPFIMAKEELTVPSEGIPPTCVDSCDKVVFGNIDKTSKEINYKYSSQQLGIYSESYGNYCYIDKVLTAQSLTEDKLLFYCGTGESGGLTNWYQYNFNNDELTTVQRMTNLLPEEFDIKSQNLLDLFRYKNNGQIQPTEKELKVLRDTAFNEKIKDWKYYENNKYGFSFKYPPQWFINVENEEYIELSEQEIIGLEIGGSTAAVAVLISDKTPEQIRELSLGSRFYKIVYDIDAQYGDETFRKVIVDDVYGRFEGDNEGRIILFFPKKTIESKYIRIRASENPGNRISSQQSKYNFDFLHDIVETFKFLN